MEQSGPPAIPPLGGLSEDPSNNGAVTQAQPQGQRDHTCEVTGKAPWHMSIIFQESKNKMKQPPPPDKKTTKGIWLRLNTPQKGNQLFKRTATATSPAPTTDTRFTVAAPVTAGPPDLPGRAPVNNGADAAMTPLRTPLSGLPKNGPGGPFLWEAGGSLGSCACSGKWDTNHPQGRGSRDRTQTHRPHLCHSRGPGSRGSSGRSQRCSPRCHSSCWDSYPPTLAGKREGELKRGLLYPTEDPGKPGPIHSSSSGPVTERKRQLKIIRYFYS